jgi:hypothetical protein
MVSSLCMTNPRSEIRIAVSLETPSIRIYHENQSVLMLHGHHSRINEIAYRLAEGERNILASVSGMFMVVSFCFLILD